MGKDFLRKNITREDAEELLYLYLDPIYRRRQFEDSWCVIKFAARILLKYQTNTAEDFNAKVECGCKYCILSILEDSFIKDEVAYVKRRR